MPKGQPHMVENENDILHLFYPGAIKAKKNSKQIIFDRRAGHMRVVSNQKAAAQERSMAKVFKLRAELKGWVASPSDHFSVAVEICNPDNIRRDLDNQLSTLLDALVHAEVLPDDGFKNVISVSCSFSGVDKLSPGAKITIINYHSKEIYEA